MLDVTQPWLSSAEHGRKLLTQRSFYVRVLVEGVEHPADQLRAGLMSCQVQGHDFITQMVLQHALAPLIARAEHDREQIGIKAVCIRGTAARGNHLIQQVL